MFIKFEDFVETNPWVETYALFKALKDVMAKNHWQTWPQEPQHLKEDQYNELIEKHWVEVCFYIFLQYLCFDQLVSVKKYANEPSQLVGIYF